MYPNICSIRISTLKLWNLYGNFLNRPLHCFFKNKVKKIKKNVKTLRISKETQKLSEVFIFFFVKEFWVHQVRDIHIPLILKVPKRVPLPLIGCPQKPFMMPPHWHPVNSCFWWVWEYRDFLRNWSTSRHKSIKKRQKIR